VFVNTESIFRDLIGCVARLFKEAITKNVYTKHGQKYE
jgi:hypothetical protein